MPITPFQAEVLRLLAQYRSPDSFLAGATVLNAAPDSPRFSRDIDIFHDLEESVAVCATRDAGVLAQHGFKVEWRTQQSTFYRADVTRGADHVKMEWVFDSAFRFFPTEPDAAVGWRLNPYDGATNKVLALMGRAEPRDYIDTLYFHRTKLALGAVCWAAAGKDPGINPFMIIEEAQRTTRYRPEQFAELQLAEPIDLVAWKRIWLAAVADAKSLFERLPAEEVGCLYLNESNVPVTPDPAATGFAKLQRHFGSVRGAWPVIRP